MNALCVWLMQSDHLLLNCKVTHKLWYSILRCFGCSCVMPEKLSINVRGFEYVSGISQGNSYLVVLFSGSHIC